MAQQRDLYEVLGVSRDATQDDIKKAYRRLARAHHPDLNQDDPEAERRFKEVSLAYETLSDPAKRRQYDVFGGEGFSPDMFSFGDVGDIFEAFFGRSPFGGGTATRTRSSRGRDLHMVMELGFEEAVFGVKKDVELQNRETCERCDGVGAEPGTSPSRCSTCGGSGQVSDMRRSIFGTVMTSRPCSRCGGEGEEIASPCTACRGDGRVPVNQTVAVEVPPGVAHGMELRVEAAGEGGRRGAPPGDLYLTLSVEPHPVFARRGSDLICALEVPLTTAILGGEIEIETLDGAEPIRVAAGTAPGSVLHLRGKGVPHLGRRGRGDLLVRMDVDVPEKLGKQERRLVEQLAEERGERGRLRGRLRPPE